MYEKLLSPIKIGTMTLANRLVVPAMVTRLSGENGMVNQAILDRYVRFATGETGLIVVEAMSIHGAKSGPLLKISGDEYKPGLTEIAKRVHGESASKIVPQIIHFLKIARSGWRQRIEDLTRDDIKLIIIQYGEAAVRARECGYDGVELHMAHAYTMSSFLSRKNKRPDEFGGKSLENRLRVPIQVLRQVRKMTGDDFPIGIRFLGEEAIKGGYTTEESSEIAVRFAEESADYLSLSAGGKFEDAVHKEGEVLYPYTGYSGDRCMPPAEYPDAYNLHMGEAARRKLRARGLMTPVISTGKISTPDLAEQILQDDRADLIGMARGLLADPDIIKKIREDRGGAIVKCIYWNVCKALDETFHEVVCGLWPKGLKQAPLSDDTVPPIWQSADPLKFLARTNQIRLNWQEALDNEEVAGYEIWRSENDGANFDHIYSVTVSMYTDNLTQSGRKYLYYVRAYDLAGNKSAQSNIVSVEVPIKIALMEEVI